MWHESDEDAPPTISGGTFEISTGIAGGAYCYYNYDEDVCIAIAPDLTNYVGAYKMTACANADGTSAVDYSESDIATYKYAKLESVHVHDYGTTWKSDETTIGTRANAEIRRTSHLTQTKTMTASAMFAIMQCAMLKIRAERSNPIRPDFPVVLSQVLPSALSQ